MAKGKRHYSGKELILRRQLERQQAETAKGNARTQQLKRINASRRAIDWAKQKMREGKGNGSVLD